MADTKISADSAATTMRSTYAAGIDGTPTNKKLPASLFTSPPQGRLTLTTLVPVLTADVTAATSIYYTPFCGNLCPIYEGTAAFFAMEPFSELTLALDSTSGHTGYHQSGKNFDLFVINDAGTIRLATGPAWSSDTSRGTGAGTTELELKNGLLTNKNTLANARFGSASGNTVSVAANLATYVGTFRASADGQTQMKFGSLAASGGEAWAGVWNAYNRRPMGVLVRDSTDTWTYTTANTWRAANNSATNRISMVRGLNEDAVQAVITANLLMSGSQNGAVGVGLDSTTTVAGAAPVLSFGGSIIPSTAAYSGLPGLGFRYLSFNEFTTGSTLTGYGDGGTTYIQSGLTGTIWQ